MKLTKEQKEYHRKYYLENREKLIAKEKERQVLNNYKHQKTAKQRAIRNIKRKTRYHFPLIKKRCMLCGYKATEHHYTTQPIKFDRFIYVCHSCHINKCKECT